MTRTVIVLCSAIGLLFNSIVYAEDCMQDPVFERDWNAEVTTGARVRNIPCMETSTVLVTLPVGEVIKVIAETDGWYKIKRTNGLEGWVGQWLITPTNKPFSSSPPPPTAPPISTLSDIIGHIYETAIQYVFDAAIVSGYPDRTYKPDITINRAEFTKIILLATTPSQDIFGENCFPDVGKEWFAPYICTALQKGIIQGYPDGTFKPGNTINFVEAASIIIHAFSYSTEPGCTCLPWYKPLVDTLAELKAIPTSITSFDSRITRGEMAEIIYRLKLNVTTKESKTYDQLLGT